MVLREKISWCSSRSPWKLLFSSWKGFVSFRVVHSDPLKDGLSSSLMLKGSWFSGILKEVPGVFRWQGAVLPSSFSVLFSPRGPRGVAPLHRDLLIILSLTRVAENLKRGSPERRGFQSSSSWQWDEDLG